jgi:hypothetical protein
MERGAGLPDFPPAGIAEGPQEFKCCRDLVVPGNRQLPGS